MTETALHIWVSGKVQGVYFRASTAKKAKKLDLSGWVKNLTDGRVEILAQGSEQSLDALLQWCDHGPMLAKVNEVKHEKLQVEQEHAPFEVLR